MLEEIRRQAMKPATIDVFRSLKRELNFGDKIVPTNLFPKKFDSERHNRLKLAELPGKSVFHKSTDFSKVHPFHELPKGPAQSKMRVDAVQHLEKHVIAVEMLELKVGAQVMLIKVSGERMRFVSRSCSDLSALFSLLFLLTLSSALISKNTSQHNLVNGSRGIVIGFLESDKVQVFQQGDCFYAKDLSGETIFGSSAIEIATATSGTRNPDAMLRRLRGKNLEIHGIVPVVRFAIGVDLVIPAMDFSVESPIGETEANRNQVPLILAWAFSIHKAQGLSLDRMVVDLQEIFENGQS